MVGQDPGGGGFYQGGRGERCLDDGAHRPCVPRTVQELEVERLVQLVGAYVQGEPLGGGGPCLRDADALAVVRVQQPAPGAVDVVHAVLVEERQDLGADHLGLLPGADVRQPLRLDHAVRDVDPEAVHAQAQPEAQDRLELLVDLGVVPVEVGLLGREEVQVPVAVGDTGPGGAAEDRLPVVGREFTGGAPGGGSGSGRGPGRPAGPPGRRGTTRAGRRCGSGRRRRSPAGSGRAPR